jgi:hypothetical protein
MNAQKTGSQGQTWIGSRLTLLAIAFACGGLVSGQITQDNPRGKDDERAGRLEEMRRLVRPFRAYKIEQGQRVAVPLRPEPLQRWNDPTRAFSDASLWVWGMTGRPVAAVAVELYPASGKKGERWAHEFVSLAGGPIEVEGGQGIEYSPTVPVPRSDGSLWWAPRRPGIELREIPGAPVPALVEADRLRQLKSLAQRFSGHEFYDRTQQTYVLRLLPHPVLRYADAGGNLVDGAVFLFAHGTNPEILLLIEAQGRAPGSATWRFGLAQLSRADLTVRLDQKDVWTRSVSPQRSTEDPYFVVQTARRPPADDPRPEIGEKP